VLVLFLSGFNDTKILANFSPEPPEPKLLPDPTVTAN